MDSKKWGIVFMIFAVLYFVFTVFLVGHGIHATNAVITIGIIVVGIYFMLKK